MGKVKVTVTNGELWGLRGEVEGTNCLKTLMQADMEMRYGYKVLRLVEKLEAEVRSIGKAYNALVEKYALLDEDPKSPTFGKAVVKSDSANREVFDKEQNDLLAISVELDVDRVQIDPKARIKPVFIGMLKPFIIDPDEAGKQ